MTDIKEQMLANPKVRELYDALGPIGPIYDIKERLRSEVKPTDELKLVNGFLIPLKQLEAADYIEQLEARLAILEIPLTDEEIREAGILIYI